MPDIIFHIGYEKTATTYLQQQIFPQVHALGNAFGVPGNHKLRKKMRSMAHQSPGIWETDAGKSLGNEIAEISDRNPVLYSQEQLLRPPIYAPIYNIHRHTGVPIKYKFSIAEHLEAFARYAWGNRGAVRVLVTIRNQAEWLASSYVQKSKRFQASQLDFEQHVRAMLKRDDYKGWRYLDYYLLYEELCAALEPGKVTFLAYEDMHTSHYWQVLNNLLDTDFEMPQNTAEEHANVRRKNDKEWQLQQRELRLYAKLPKRLFNLSERVKTYEGRIMRALTNQHKTTIQIPDDLRAEIMDVFANSNRAIADVMNRDLSAYGYY